MLVYKELLKLLELMREEHRGLETKIISWLTKSRSVRSKM